MERHNYQYASIYGVHDWFQTLHSEFHIMKGRLYTFYGELYILKGWFHTLNGALYIINGPLDTLIATSRAAIRQSTENIGCFLSSAGKPREVAIAHHILGWFQK